MGDLDVDTRIVATGPTSFSAHLSSDWEIWGPNGGYLTSIAMRAAGAVSGRARPASVNAHFVGSGTMEPVDLDVVVNRATKVATSATVTVSQSGRPLAVVMVWSVDDGLEGLEHDASTRPADLVAGPDGLRSAADRLAESGTPQFVFWNNMEGRPLTWVDDWDHREAADPVKRSWYRFTPTETFADPWVDAMRSLVLIDVDGWPATALRHVGELAHYAPTIEVSARFIGSAAASPWLYSVSAAPVAAGGLVGATAEIWTRDGRLVALGGSTLLSRPAARRPVVP